MFNQKCAKVSSETHCDRMLLKVNAFSKKLINHVVRNALIFVLHYFKAVIMSPTV